MRPFRRTIASLLFAGLSVLAFADDTELYMGQVTTATDVPNILFVLDRSSSMSNTVSGSAAPVLGGTRRFDHLRDALLLLLPEMNNVNVGFMTFTQSFNTSYPPETPVHYNIPLRFPVIHIDTPLNEVPNHPGSASGAGTVKTRISNAYDDAEENTEDGSMQLFDANLEITHVSGGGEGQPLPVFISSGSTWKYQDDSVDIYQQNPGWKGIAFVDSSWNSGAAQLGYGDGDESTVVGYTGNKYASYFRHSFNISDASIYAGSTGIISIMRDDGAVVYLNGIEIFRSNMPTGTISHTSRAVNTAASDNEWVNSAPFSGSLLVDGTNVVTVSIHQKGSGSSDISFDLELGPDSSGTNSSTEIAAGSMWKYHDDSVDIYQQNPGWKGIAFDDSLWNSGAAQLGYGDSDENTVVGHTGDKYASYFRHSFNISDASLYAGATGIVSIQRDDGAVVYLNGTEIFRTNMPTGTISHATRAGDSIGSETAFFDSDTFLGSLLVDGTNVVSVSVHQKGSGSSDISFDLALKFTGMAASDPYDQKVGLRFRDVQLPQGATITNAYIEFTSRSTSDDAASYSIHVEDSGDSAAFSQTAGDISARTLGSSVDWTLLSETWTIGELYQTPDLKTLVQSIVNRSDWCGGNAMSFIISSMSTAERDILSYDGSSSGAPQLVVEFDPGSVAPDACGANTETARDYLYEMIANLDFHSGTPLVPAILEAGMYYSGDNLLYGDNRRNNAANRVAHPGGYTGGTVVRDAGCTDDNLGASACQTETITGTPVYTQPTISQCQPNFIVFLTDGLASKNDSHTREAIKTFADISSCEGSGSEECGVDMVRALYDTDFAPELPGLQNVITHTIAFAVDAQSGRDYMQEWANAGGGDSYAADNALELLDAFRQILATIITDSTSFAAPSLSINAFSRLDHDNQVYFALFKPEHLASWDGNVKKYNICDDDESCGAVGIILDANANPAMSPENKIRNGCGTSTCSDDYVAVDLWNPIPSEPDGSNVHKGGTGDVLLQRVQPQASPNDRNIYTDIGGILTEVVTANSSTLRAELGVSTDAEAETLINWIRGYQDGDPNAGVREWLLDDSLHSAPGAITIGKDGSDNAITKIFLATNEGAIRMLDGETGAEDWMFIPKEMLSIQQTLMVNPSGDSRTYGIDGNIAFIVHDGNKDEVIDPGAGDFVKLFVGMRRGGRNIYALDVTPDHQPSLLWTIKGGTGDFVRLGQTWSMPKPTKVRFGGVSKTVLLFGGGYEPETQDDPSTYSSVSAYSNAIYMVDPDDGTRLWWASNTGSGADLELTGMDYSIPSDLDLMDGSGDGLTDRIYVGDTGGQVWRIDLDSGIGGRLASLGKTDADVSNKRRFFYPPEVLKLRDRTYTPGSYSDYDLVLIGSGHRPNPLGTDIQDRLYALRDRAIKGLIDVDGDGEAEMDEPSDLPSYQFFTLSHDYLFDATANLIQDGDDTEKAAALASLQDNYGWYIDLDRSGEKNLSAPLVVLGVAYFTTFVPPTIDASSDCVTAEGSGWIYALDILTGAAVNPDYDGNEDQIEKSDRRKKIGEGIPSKVVPIIIGDKIVLLTGSGGGIYSENVPFGNDQNGNEPRILYWIEE
ncbi:MAG: hypothetical protein ABFS56_24095 [Pseudomonadota bacterium]